jgi:hypothetical protein
MQLWKLPPNDHDYARSGCDHISDFQARKLLVALRDLSIWRSAQNRNRVETAPHHASLNTTRLRYRASKDRHVGRDRVEDTDDGVRLPRFTEVGLDIKSR